jgi:hypothetical protein
MSTITLTTAEQDLIEARRAEEQATADRKAAEESARQAKIDEAKTRHETAVESKRSALRKVDTNNILFTPEDKTGLYFLLDGRTHEVRIEEHRVCSSGSWRARNAGIKYKLDNEYNNRYLSNPKTVIKKIVELQEAIVARLARVEKATDLNDRALEVLKRKYPNAEVAFQKGYDYRNNRNRYSHSNYQPDHITVTTPNGTVEFTYSNDTPTPGVNEEGVKFSVRARKPSAEIRDKITALILG